MRGLVILFGLVAVACAVTIDHSFDSVDVHQYDDDAKLKVLVKCVTSEGPCTPLENTLKGRVPGIMVSHCADCSSSERDIIVLLTNRIAQVNEADIFKILNLIFPTGKGAKSYILYLNSISELRGFHKLSDSIINELPDSS